MSDGERRIVVTRGRPTDVELAAVVVALTPVAVDAGDESPPSGWLRAAIVESHGRALVSDVGDVGRHGGW